MTSRYIQFAPIVLALSAALFTPLASADSPMNSGNSSMQDKRSPSMSDSSMDMKTMMKANNEMMSSMEMTGKPDIDFALMMRAHHQGGIKMAEAELRDGKDATMRKMAKTIIAGQKKEIAQLNVFLTKQGYSADNKHNHPADPMRK